MKRFFKVEDTPYVRAAGLLVLQHLFPYKWGPASRCQNTLSQQNFYLDADGYFGICIRTKNYDTKDYLKN